MDLTTFNVVAVSWVVWTIIDKSFGITESNCKRSTKNTPLPLLSLTYLQNSCGPSRWRKKQQDKSFTKFLKKSEGKLLFLCIDLLFDAFHDAFTRPRFSFYPKAKNKRNNSAVISKSNNLENDATNDTFQLIRQVQYWTKRLSRVKKRVEFVCIAINTNQPRRRSLIGTQPQLVLTDGPSVTINIREETK